MTLRLLRRAARLIREQVDREEHAHLIASFTRLDHGVPVSGRGLMATHPLRHPKPTASDDPLERLWSLPAWSGGARNQ
jgi:hypothetical protein